MDLNLLKGIAAWLGVPVVLILAGAIIVTVYPQAKILIGDLLSLVGRTAKWIRRASLQSEIEGSLSLFCAQLQPRPCYPPSTASRGQVGDRRYRSSCVGTWKTDCQGKFWERP